MAAGTVIKHKRKAGAFANGELQAGEWGLDVTNSIWYFSLNGTTVVPLIAGVDTANSPNANEFARFTDANTIEGRTVSETKTDLALENVTNESKATMFTNAALTGTPTAPTPTAGDNDTSIATTAFVTDAISTAVTGLLDFKGSTDASGNPNYPAASKGDAYVVSVAGKVGGASGKSVDIGDVYVATADNAGGTEASVGMSWTVLEHNLVGAYVAGGTDVAVADGGTGASDASGARTNLELVIGTHVQAYDANLLAIAALTTTSFGRGLLELANQAALLSAAGAAAASHSHAATDITSGDLATARMQTNVVAAINAVGGTVNDSDVIIDGGTI